MKGQLVTEQLYLARVSRGGWLGLSTRITEAPKSANHNHSFSDSIKISTQTHLLISSQQREQVLDLPFPLLSVL